MIPSFTGQAVCQAHARLCRPSAGKDAASRPPRCFEQTSRTLNKRRVRAMEYESHFLKKHKPLFLSKTQMAVTDILGSERNQTPESTRSASMCLRLRGTGRDGSQRGAQLRVGGGLLMF